MENRRSEDDKVSRGTRKAVETGTRKVGVGKVEERRSKRRSWKDNRGKKGGRGIRDMEMKRKK